MSFHMRIDVKNGQPVVAAYAEVPDGTYTVSGHEDLTRRDLALIRQGPDGRFIGSAHQSHGKEQ